MMTRTPARKTLAQVLATGKYRIEKELLPLPTTKEGGIDRTKLLESISTSLSKSLVQRVVVSAEAPILVERLVEGPPAKSEQPEDEFFYASMNEDVLEVSELMTNSRSSADALVAVMTSIESTGLQVPAVIVNSLESLRTWLKIPNVGATNRFLGARVIEDARIPETSILIVAASTETADSVVYTVRIPAYVGAPT